MLGPQAAGNAAISVLPFGLDEKVHRALRLNVGNAAYDAREREDRTFP